jgi:multidrug efflux pump subunit AcrB
MRADLFFTNPRLTILCVGLILVGGAASLQTLPRQEDPTLSRRFANITTFFPGATAERVESLVTDPIETRILELHEVKEIRSFSRNSVSMIRVELEDDYYEGDVDEIWSKVRDRLADAQAELPAGAAVPDFEDLTTTAATLVVALKWEGEGPAQVDLMTRLARDLENSLRTLAGTKEVDILGGAGEEVRVTVDPTVLAAAGLTVGDVSRAIAAADAKAPAGLVRREDSDLLIEVGGELDSLARVREVPVRSGRDGRMVRVGDIARVEKTVREPPSSIALVHGLRSVVVEATAEPMQRVDRWTVRARETVQGFAAQMPAGVGVETIFDQSVYTNARLETLVGNLVMAAVIVVAVLVFMMGLRAALVVATALPLTLALAVAEFSVVGVPLHQTSITGLIIALGLLIDNAIVVVEEFSSRRREGAPPGDAVSEVVHQLFVPLLASTVTTMLAFLPIILMPGAAGEFVGPISAGVILSVGSSFFLSMTVLAAFAGFFIRPRSRQQARRWWRDGYSNTRLTLAFGKLLDLCLRRPIVGVGIAVVLPICGFAAAQSLVEQFFPANDRNQFQIQVRMPTQTSLAATRKVVEQVRELVESEDEVLESHWFIGEDSPRVYYNMFGAEEGIASFAGGFVTTKSAKATEHLLPGLQRRLMRGFPMAEVIALPFEQGPPFDAPIEARLYGTDTEILRRLGDRLRLILSETDHVTYTRAQLARGTPKLMLDADEVEADLAGVKLRDIADRLQGNLEGIVAATIIEGSEEIDVRVRVGEGERAELENIDRTRLGSVDDGGSGRLGGVPLEVVADFELVPESPTLVRRDGVRVNNVQAMLVPYTLIAESLKDFRRRLEGSDFRLPAGYRLEFGGEAEERGEALDRLVLFAFPLFVVMAGTIILSFNSFRMAAIIFVVAALSVGLALLGVWMFGYPLGFVAIVGTMGLVGLAINDAIVVLAALRGSAGARRGDVEETREVVIGATRHVLATTLTTIGGFLPLIYFGGRFWPPMATAIAGGVGGSSILALFLVPSTFIWLARRERRAAPSRPSEDVVDAPLDGRDTGDREQREGGAPHRRGSPGDVAFGEG